MIGNLSMPFGERSTVDSRRRRTTICCAALMTLLAVGGCSGTTARLPIAGAVTLDDKPVTKGQITFIPMPETKGPTAGAAIIDGRYSIASEKGPMVGAFRVEITAARPTSRTKQTLNVASGQMEVVEEYESIVPPRYNRDSELTGDVTAEGPNKIDFALKSN